MTLYNNDNFKFNGVMTDGDDSDESCIDEFDDELSIQNRNSTA